MICMQFLPFPQAAAQLRRTMRPTPLGRDATSPPVNLDEVEREYSWACERLLNEVPVIRELRKEP